MTPQDLINAGMGGPFNTQGLPSQQPTPFSASPFASAYRGITAVPQGAAPPAGPTGAFGGGFTPPSAPNPGAGAAPAATAPAVPLPQPRPPMAPNPGAPTSLAPPNPGPTAPPAGLFAGSPFQPGTGGSSWAGGVPSPQGQNAAYLQALAAAKPPQQGLLPKLANDITGLSKLWGGSGSGGGATSPFNFTGSLY